MVLGGVSHVVFRLERTPTKFGERVSWASESEYINLRYIS